MTLLNTIIDNKHNEIIQLKKCYPLNQLLDNITFSQRNFYQALKKPHTLFILECKKASPSKGVIRHDFNVAKICQIYQYYADVISVLTDRTYFQGSYDNLTIASQHSHQPILCKDFIIDAHQIYLARVHRADAVLLMLSVLGDDDYRQLSTLAHQLHMGVLTEVSNLQELQRALKLDAQVIGINNRDLRDLSIDLKRTEILAMHIPKHITVISESGISSRTEIKRLRPYVNGFLVGSTLMTSNALKTSCKQLIYGENKVCGLTNSQDAYLCDQAGAVYGGLIFATDSPRFITLEEAQVVTKSNTLKWVAVFRHQPIDDITEYAKQLPLHAVQLHGDYTAEQLTQLRQQLPTSCQIWQAINMSSPSPPTQPTRSVDCYVYDQGLGGTGQPFDWQKLHRHKYPDGMLAGGITPENITLTHDLPILGIDVNSGVEYAIGKKDSTKIKQLFLQLRQAHSLARHCPK